MPDHQRPPRLQSFLDSVRRSYQCSRPDEATQGCLKRVFDALESTKPCMVSGCGYLDSVVFLDAALKHAAAADEPLSTLAREIKGLQPILEWQRRAGVAPNASMSFSEGHANAMVVGPRGIEERRDVWVGISLLEPGVRYPDHSHFPEEIYLALTPGTFRHGSRDWFEPGVGGSFYNEPGIDHAMAASEEQPLLAIWCLFDPRFA